ncbi:hypothetical protein ACQP3L_35660, partial [Escherichia coli]
AVTAAEMGSWSLQMMSTFYSCHRKAAMLSILPLMLHLLLSLGPFTSEDLMIDCLQFIHILG